MKSDIELPTIHPKKSIALIAVGLFIYALYLYYAGYQDAIDSLRGAAISLFALAVILALLGVFCDALAWRAIAL